MKSFKQRLLAGEFTFDELAEYVIDHYIDCDLVYAACPKCGAVGDRYLYVARGGSADGPKEQLRNTCRICGFTRPAH